jgi:hypothetical protein
VGNNDEHASGDIRQGVLKSKLLPVFDVLARLDTLDQVAVNVATNIIKSSLHTSQRSLLLIAEQGGPVGIAIIEIVRDLPRISHCAAVVDKHRYAFGIVWCDKRFFSEPPRNCLERESFMCERQFDPPAIGG